MAVALSFRPAFLDSLQGLLAWLVPPPAVPAPVVRTSVRRAVHVAVPRVQRRALQVPRAADAARPLRVVRVVEPSTPRAVAGRMVISGRLADVCAELDRLAAQEAR